MRALWKIHEDFEIAIKNRRKKVKLIYDFDEEDLAKKVRIEKEDGTCEYFPFYDFKFENSSSHTLRLKTWVNEKERRKFYEFEPIVVEQTELILKKTI